MEQKAVEVARTNEAKLCAEFSEYHVDLMHWPILPAVRN